MEFRFNIQMLERNKSKFDKIWYKLAIQFIKHNGNRMHLLKKQGNFYYVSKDANYPVILRVPITLQLNQNKINQAYGYQKQFGGTDKRNGKYFSGKQGLLDIVKMSKQNPSRIFRVVSNNYTNFKEVVIKNGKFASNKSFNMATNFAKYPLKSNQLGQINNTIFLVYLLDKSWT